MRARHVLAFAASFTLATAFLAQDSGAAKAAEVKAGASTPVFMPPGNVPWTDLDPVGAPGIKIADLWGDHTKSAYGAFLKFPAGFMSPLHTHTSAIRAIVLSGTYTQTPEGKPEVRLGPGSYMLQPGGSYKHISGCDKASECLLFIESDGMFDLNVVAPPTK